MLRLVAFYTRNPETEKMRAALTQETGSLSQSKRAEAHQQKQHVTIWFFRAPSNLSPRWQEPLPSITTTA